MYNVYIRMLTRGQQAMKIKIKEAVKKHKAQFNINYVVLDVPPVAGAAIWALNTLAPGNEGQNYDRVCAQLRE